MSWKCDNCDTYNDDGTFECFVCGNRNPSAGFAARSKSVAERGSAYDSEDSGASFAESATAGSGGRRVRTKGSIFEEEEKIRKKLRRLEIARSAVRWLKKCVNISFAVFVFIVLVLIIIRICQNRGGDILQNISTVFKAAWAKIASFFESEFIRKLWGRLSAVAFRLIGGFDA